MKCYQSNDKHFLGVVVTNGAGSPRKGIYADFTDEQMQEVRRIEQKKAADIGEYSALALLDYSSRDIKDKDNVISVDELINLIKEAKPKVIYTHNLADKHDTHVAVTVKVIKAIRSLPKKDRPKKLYGCEVWRGLDWMLDVDKVVFDVDKHTELAMNLVKVFDSQIAGGKRYDLATAGRRLANATYAASHATDTSQSLIYGMDLTPLIENDDLNISEYVLEYIRRMMSNINQKIISFI